MNGCLCCFCLLFKRKKKKPPYICGRQNNGAPNISISYYLGSILALHGQRNFIDVIKFQILWWESILAYPGGPNLITGASGGGESEIDWLADTTLPALKREGRGREQRKADDLWRVERVTATTASSLQPPERPQRCRRRDFSSSNSFQACRTPER